MSTRSRLLGLAAAAFVFINVAGAGYAVAMGEFMHAATHVAVLVVGVSIYSAWRRRQAEQQILPGVQQAAASIGHLQQTVDAIALEVERIGEAQRFETRLLQERIQKSSQKKEQ